MWVGEFLHSPQVFAYAKKHVNTAKERRKFSPACWRKKIPQKLPNSFPKLGKKYDKIRCFVSLILDTKKPLKTLNFQGFMLNFNQILFLSCCCLLFWYLTYLNLSLLNNYIFSLSYKIYPYIHKFLFYHVFYLNLTQFISSIPTSYPHLKISYIRICSFFNCYRLGE